MFNKYLPRALSHVRNRKQAVRPDRDTILHEMKIGNRLLFAYFDFEAYNQHIYETPSYHCVFLVYLAGDSGVGFCFSVN